MSKWKPIGAPPKEAGEVLVFDRRGLVWVAYFTPGVGFSSGHAMFNEDLVIYWMPLPPPPEGLEQ